MPNNSGALTQGFFSFSFAYGSVKVLLCFSFSAALQLAILVPFCHSATTSEA